MRAIVVAALALSCAGCATITEGTSQPIVIDANAPQAVCTVSRNGVLIGTSTPGNRTVTVEKSKSDLSISCSAPGYADKTETLSSELSAMTVASFAFIDLGIVDAATGAWKKYPSKLTMLMQPTTPTARRR